MAMMVAADANMDVADADAGGARGAGAHQGDGEDRSENGFHGKLRVWLIWARP